MGLNIAVCIKPVPDPAHYDKIRIDPVRKTVVREGIPTIMNPCDKHALEAALQLRGADGTVTVITMAPPNAEETLREALAMGADAAVLLTDRAFAGADTWATSILWRQACARPAASTSSSPVRKAPTAQRHRCRPNWLSG